MGIKLQYYVKLYSLFWKVLSDNSQIWQIKVYNLFKTKIYII